MQDLRDLECLIALARHRHFAKAADQCGLSQPAFSMRIRALEERLDARIVKRGNRFQGFTPEGESVLEHAKTIVGQVRIMEQDLRTTAGEVHGTLTLGVIPTAAAYAAQIAQRLKENHPGIRARIETGSSLAIQQGVDDGSFDAGLTYTEDASKDMLEVKPLYDESYVLLVPETLMRRKRRKISWEEAATLPLVLLETDMRNRRIIDAVFREVGAHPKVVAETDGLTAALVMAVAGMGATIIPRGMWKALEPIGNTQAIPLVSPVVEKNIGLVSRRHGSAVPTVSALKELLDADIQ